MKFPYLPQYWQCPFWWNPPRLPPRTTSVDSTSSSTSKNSTLAPCTSFVSTKICRTSRNWIEVCLKMCWILFDVLNLEGLCKLRCISISAFMASTRSWKFIVVTLHTIEMGMYKSVSFATTCFYSLHLTTSWSYDPSSSTIFHEQI